MKKLKAHCEKIKTWHQALYAQYPWERMKGLLGKKELNEEELMILPRTYSIHTFFMSIPIDVVYLDASRTIQKIVHALQPGKLSSSKKTFYTLEMKACLAQKLGLQKGMQFFWEENGQVTLEFALIIAVFILAVIAALPTLIRAFQEYVAQLLFYMSDI